MEIEVLARAVIEKSGRFLIAHSKGASNVFLPGGHIEHGEPIVETLKRELWEELGVEVEVEHYLGAIEHYWETDGLATHEVNHIFQVTAAGLSPAQTPNSQEHQLEFFWLKPDELIERNLQPSPLQELLGERSRNADRIWWASTIDARAAQQD